jgi:hypothetical protein
MASMGVTLVMTAIHTQPSARVTVVVLPSSSVGRGEEIVAPMSLGGGSLGSLAWLELEENEGATMALADVETKVGLLTELEEGRTQGDEHFDQVGDSSVLQAALEGN